MFVTEHILTELWIMALCCIVNRTEDIATVHEDHAEALAAWRAPNRPRA